MTVTVGNIAKTPTPLTPGFYDPAQVPSDPTKKELGRVDAIFELNGVTYIGGNYARTVDNSAGAVNFVDQANSYITAWRSDNWARITTWTATMPGRVYWITASGDGTSILVGGSTQGLKAFAPLSGPTDTSAPVAQTVPVLSNGDVQWIGSVGTAAWIVGGFSGTVGGHATVNAARMTKSGSVWTVDAAFTCAGPGGQIKIGAIKPDGTKLLIGGDFNGAVLAFSGTTGAGISWGFNFTTAEGEGPNQSCICIDSDASMVAMSGDFGQNIYIVTDWTGAGPSHFTNISGGWDGYWYHTSDGNMQYVKIGQMNGAPVIFSGHHGGVAATAKNAASGAGDPSSVGMFVAPWTTAGGDRVAYNDPDPSFNNPSNTSTPLKVWSIYQSPTTGNLMVGGDFTSAANPQSLNSQRRFAVFAATVTGGGGGGGGGGTATATKVQEKFDHSPASAVASFTVTMGSAVTPGNTLVLHVVSNTSARRLGTITDDGPGGNVWTKLAESGSTSAGSSLLWACRTVTGGTVFTIPWTTGTAQGTAILQEWSGLDNAAALPGTAAGLDDTVTGTTHTTPQLTTSAAAFLIAGIGSKINPDFPFTSSAGWTESGVEGGQAGTSNGLATMLSQVALTNTSNTFTYKTGGATSVASLTIGALPVVLSGGGGGGGGGGTTPPPPPKPVYGLDDSCWAAASPEIGGVKGWRGYDTPKTTIPTAYPHVSSGPPPAGVTFRIVSLKPDVPTFLSGSLDASFSAWCALVTPGDIISLWHEGETGDGWTPTQIKQVHAKAYGLAKAANPQLIYAQIVATYSAQSSSAAGFPLHQWIGVRNDGGPLDVYLLDGYNPTGADTVATVFGVAVADIQTVVPTAQFGIAETNAMQNAPGQQRANWFNAAYSYAVANHHFCFFPYFFAEGSTGNRYPWVSTDTNTIAELSAENADSQGNVGGGGGGGSASSYTIPASISGQYLSVLETATDGLGNSTSVRSNVVGPIAGSATVPLNTVAPDAGTLQVLAGTSLTWSQGTWTNTPTSYVNQVQLKALGAADSTASDISGATSLTYTTLQSQIGFQVRMKTVAHNAAGDSVQVFSVWVSIEGSNQVPTVPTITMTNPSQDTTVAAAAGTLFTVTGNAFSDTPITGLFVNQNPTAVNAQGNFSWPITLSEGSNPIMVFAVDQDGDTASVIVTVTLVVPGGGQTTPIVTSDDVDRVQTQLHERGVD